MTRIPPLLPEETLARVKRVAHTNGTSVLIVAGFFAVGAALGRDFVGAAAGLIVAGAGAMEVHGGTLLDHGEPRGMDWLVSSELIALIGILVYCAARLIFVQIPPLPDWEWAKRAIELDAKQLGMTVDQFQLLMYRITFPLLAILSVFYQGGVALYYARRRRIVQHALAQINAAE